MIGALAQRCVRLGTAPRLLATPTPAQRPRRVYRPYRRTTVLACAAQSPRRLSIIHFNDVYDIAERKIEPVGGAARFAAAVQSFAAEDPLVLFSGDCLNPSLLSAFTKGEQMVPILNAIGVKAACLGNHDFDFGMDALRHHMAAWDFPWLLSNVLDANTGQPLAGAARSLIIEWGGLRIGLLGLVEREWLLTIPSIDPNKDITYLDFVEEGRRLAADLHADGVDLMVALTHMRSPNDEALAAQVPEIQLILGGHDHDYAVTPAAGPYGTAIVKSGTDFREFSVIRLEVPAAGDDSSSSRSSSGNGTSSANGSSSASASTPVHLPPRPRVLACERVEISSALPEHPGVAAIVADYQELMDTHMDQPLGRSFVDLDTRFDRVRCKETNAGSLLADIMRLGLDADAAFLNGGTIRSDQIHEAGRVSMRDFVAMLPFTDELVVVELDGAGLLQALETGVSSWPKREGRFLQVSGIQFRFDPEKAPGARVDIGSVRVGGALLDTTGKRRYRVATKAYLRSGKDGFDSLLTAPVVVDGETAPRLATLVYHLLSRIEELNEAQGSNTAEESEEEGGDGHHSPHQEPAGGRRLRAVGDAPLHLAPCAHGLDALYFYDEITGQFGIAPTAEGRIVNVAEMGAAAGARAASTTAADTPMTP